MVAKTQQKPSQAEGQIVEKRRISRQISGRSVVVKSSHGERARATVRDVSIYGCCLVGDAPWVRTGSFVSIVVSADRAIQAIVRWTRGGVTGVEFLRAISEDEAAEIV